MTAWSAEPFIEAAIQQAIEYCDEVIIAVGAHHKNLYRFKDNTWNICNKYKNKITLMKSLTKNNHPNSKGSTMKKMLDDTNNNKEGNWIWFLDADEFYFEEDVNRIKQIITEDNYSQIELPERFFLINMNYYAKWKRIRIKRLNKDNVSFHTNKINQDGGNILKLNTDNGIHHYSLLINPYFKREFWKCEYNDSNSQPIKDKVKWLNEVYLKFNYENQEEYIKKCEEWFNKKSILGCILAPSATDNGYLYLYNNKQPKFIEKTDLVNIKDFREIYKNEEI